MVPFYRDQGPERPAKAFGSPAGEDPEEARTAHASGEAAREVLAGLGEPGQVMLASCGGNGRVTPMARFLSCRLDRLAIAADEIATAAAANDVVALRRGTVKFRALAVAMWKVQLAVCGSPSMSGPPALGRDLLGEVR